MKLRNFGYVAIAMLVAVVFAIGSAVPSEAKAKKKKAEAGPPQQTVVCWFSDKKVCAVKGGAKYTYQNACYAAKDGAKVASDGACPSKAAKPAKKSGKKKAKKKK